MAALGSAAAEDLATKGVFSDPLMERHRSRALRLRNQRHRQCAGLLERVVPGSDARANHFEGLWVTIDRRPARGGRAAPVSRLSSDENRPGAESRSGGRCLATAGLPLEEAAVRSSGRRRFW